MESGFEQRGRAFEDGFFHQKDKELLQKLKNDLAAKSAKEGLAEASGITNDEVLDELVGLGITAESVLALSVFPLVYVAWSDKSMDEKEREAILSAAAENGCKSGSPSYATLESWLTEPPSDELFDVWKDYTQEVLKSLTSASATAAAELRATIVQRMKDVAEAAGGFLGIGKTSADEAGAIAEIEAAMNG